MSAEFQSIGDIAASVVRKVDILRPKTREEWLALRMQDVTASVAGCLLGIHPYTTAYALWAEKSGRVAADNDDSPAKRRGRMLEPVVAAMLREDRPDWTIEYPLDNRYYRDELGRLGATPDAFATRPDIPGIGNVQFKTASEQAFREQWLDPDTREVVLPLWIAVQAIVEADLTGASWVSVALLVVGRGIDLHIIDVPLHAGLRIKLREKVAEFWHMVSSGGQPSVDWLRDGPVVLDVYRDSEPTRVNLTGNAEIDILVGRYVEAKGTANSAGKTADELKAQIIMALGNAEAGQTIHWDLTAKTQHRRAYEVKESQSRVLRIKPREAA